VIAIIQGLRRIAPHYDVVLLDQAAGLDPHTMRFSKAADRAVVVVTEEPTSLTDGYAFVKVLKLADPEAPPPWVVVNMAENRVKGRGVYDQFAKACEKYLGFRPPLAGVICRDARVPDAIRAQTPLPVRHPQSQAFDDVMRIADALGSG
jgi:flagellar biosynthesis protein FlhG